MLKLAQWCKIIIVLFVVKSHKLYRSECTFGHPHLFLQSMQFPHHFAVLVSTATTQV